MPANLPLRIDGLAGPLVVEGSGGIMVPLNEREHLVDVARLAKLEVVLAVGLRLGCINHALLTLEACQEGAFRSPVRSWSSAGARPMPSIATTLLARCRETRRHLAFCGLHPPKRTP